MGTPPTVSDVNSHFRAEWGVNTRPRSSTLGIPARSRSRIHTSRGGLRGNTGSCAPQGTSLRCARSCSASSGAIATTIVLRFLCMSGRQMMCGTLLSRRRSDHTQSDGSSSRQPPAKRHSPYSVRADLARPSLSSRERAVRSISLASSVVAARAPWPISIPSGPSIAWMSPASSCRRCRSSDFSALSTLRTVAGPHSFRCCFAAQCADTAAYSTCSGCVHPASLHTPRTNRGQLATVPGAQLRACMCWIQDSISDSRRVAGASMRPRTAAPSWGGTTDGTACGVMLPEIAIEVGACARVNLTEISMRQSASPRVSVYGAFMEPPFPR